MATTTLMKLAFMLLMNLVICSAESSIGRKSNPNPEEFVKSSCRATRYPVLCVKSLLAYASVIRRSDRQLATTALSVSISRSRSSAWLVKKMLKARGMKPREYRAVQDCVENIGDSVDRLRHTQRGEEFVWHMSNVLTWLSAALTDDSTCLDGFAGSAMNGNVKALIKDRIVHVAQVTSNALALVNRFASRHPSATQTP
ncbi:21 kDa protein [Glycine soja]|nr:21 kDa protein [Glycine soja]